MGLFFAMRGVLWVYSLPREGACGSIFAMRGACGSVLCHERGLVGLFFATRGGLWVYSLS